MLESMSHIVPSLAWLIPIPFYFMELLVGIVQALVFMLLTAVFTLLIAQHEPGHEVAPLKISTLGPWTPRRSLEKKPNKKYDNATNTRRNRR